MRGHIESRGRRQRFAFHFVVATEDVLPYSKPHAAVGQGLNEKQHFHTRAQPGTAVARRHGALAAERAGDIFAAPYSGPGAPAR